MPRTGGSRTGKTSAPSLRPDVKRLLTAFRALALKELPPDSLAARFDDEAIRELTREDNARRLFKLVQQAGKGHALRLRSPS